MKTHNLTLLWTAFGDALGVPYEAQAPTDEYPTMHGGGIGHYAPYEYSDDTQMSVAIAMAACRSDLRTEAGIHAVAEEFIEWKHSKPADIGTQTGAALRDALKRDDEDILDGMRRGAREYKERHKWMSAGNGALMRTAIIGTLPYSREEARDVAVNVADLTHYDPEVRESCILWTDAVWRGFRGLDYDLMHSIDMLEEIDRQHYWMNLIDHAEQSVPRDYRNTGYTVRALQSAWSAISSYGTTADALVHIAQSGSDTDTVAAIAGGLIGAVRHDTDVPPEWLNVHGWPNLDASGLVTLATQASGISA